MLKSFAWVVWAAVAGIWPKFGDDPLENTLPMEAKGDIHFQADAVFFLDDGEPALDVALAIPQSALGGTDESVDSIRVEVELLNANGNASARYLTRMALPPDTVEVEGAFPIPSRWIRLRPQWVPGTVGIRVILEDLTAIKRTIVDQLSGNHPKGEIAGRIPRPSWTTLEASPTSGLLFAWQQSGDEPPADQPGLRSVRDRLQPHPFRYYGLYQPVLSLYWERYPPYPESGLAPGDPIEVRYRITTVPEGAEALVRTDTLRVADGSRWELKRFDVSALRSGSYRMELTLDENDTDPPLAQVEGRFQVLWEKGTWELDEAQMLTYARVLFSGREYEEFAALGRGEKEAYYRDFWNEHDPTPRGQRNRLETVFYARVAYANHNFKGFRPGMLTDRGRVYIRYGPPDEISFNLNPQDHELLWNILPSEIGEDSDSMEETLRETRRRSPFDNRAYEIWEYTVRGDPLLPEYVPPGMRTGLKFIFVDELGYGDYSLVYTNISGGLQ